MSFFEQNKEEFSNYKKTFLKNREKISKTLYIWNPTMKKILYYWSGFNELRLIDVKEFNLIEKDPFRIQGYVSVFLSQSEKCRSTLLNR